MNSLQNHRGKRATKQARRGKKRRFNSPLQQSLTVKDVEGEITIRQLSAFDQQARLFELFVAATILWSFCDKSE